MSRPGEGYNESDIKSVLSNIQNSYENLSRQLQVEFQNKMVNNVAEKWTTPAAVNFYKNVKPVIDEMNKAVNETYLNINESINSAASAWVGAASYNMQSWASIELKNIINRTLDITCVKEIDSAGNVQMEIDNVRTILETDLNAIRSNVDSALADLRSAVSVTGFLDSKDFQSAELQASVDKIKNTINESLTQFYNNFKNAIIQRADVHATVTSKVGSAFDGKAS